MKYIIIIPLALALCVLSYAQEVTYSFRIEGMTCDNCAQTITQALSKMEGVTSAKVVYDSKTATVLTDNSISQEDLRLKIKEINFEALFGDETLALPLTDEERKNLDIRVIEGGGKLKIKNYLTSGVITIFDFYADWCGPCRIFSPKLERLLLGHANLRLVKADIVDWESPLSKQLTKDYQFPSLPFVLIFDEKGKLLGKVRGNFVEKVEAIIKKNEK